MTAPDRLLRRRALGSEAVYRVLDDEGDVVLVEVVEAPGLQPGTRIRLAAADARAMEGGGQAIDHSPPAGSSS